MRIADIFLDKKHDPILYVFGITIHGLDGGRKTMGFLDEISKGKKLKKPKQIMKPNVYETKVKPLWVAKNVEPGFDMDIFTGLLEYKWGGHKFKESTSTLKILIQKLREKDPFKIESRKLAEGIPGIKQMKYTCALGYLKNSTSANSWGQLPAYTFVTNRSNTKLRVKQGEEKKLTIHKILGHKDEAWPDLADERRKSKNDVKYIKEIGAYAVMIVRALLCLGALNNRMMINKQQVWMCNGDPNNLVDGHRLARNIAGWIENLAGNFADIKDGGTMLNQIYRMAGYSYGARLMGGGVCAHISLVTLGVLTTIAEDIDACSVYSDKACGGFDHNFVLARKGKSGWWAIDPWPGKSYVLPWEDCLFRKEKRTKYKYYGLGNCTQLHIHSSVIVPYGIGFTGEEINKSSQKFDFKYVSSYTTEKGWTWTHLTNNKSGHRSLLVAMPEQWGKGML